jgi:hypothetical protein
MRYLAGPATVRHPCVSEDRGVATLYRWKLEYPEFSRVFKLGKAAADDRVERSLYSRAVGYSYLPHPPNPRGVWGAGSLAQI